PILPTALTPLAENWANKSWAFDFPIVPFAAEGILPEYQYTENTTELAKALSHIVGTLPGVGEMNTFSPAKAENFIRGYTGGGGMYALNALDYVLRKTGALPDPVKPTPTLADIPFVRAFVVRHPSMNAEPIAQFREHWQEASSYMKTINRLEKEFKYEDIANLMPYHLFNALQGSYEALSTIQRTIQQVNKTPSMTADEKRQTIDTLYYQAITIAKYGNETYEKIKPMIKELKERAEKVEKKAPRMELVDPSFGEIVIP
uniref:LPD38 domain-containing protein n=1 Tax=Bilophila sp. TaxID=1929485 RepID=UPI003076A30C